MNELRKDFSRARDSYHRSGNQDAENAVDEFAKYCRGDASVLYAFIVWGDLAQARYDRCLPLELQREEGLDDFDDINTSASQEISSLSSQSAEPRFRKRRKGSEEVAPSASKKQRELLEQQLLQQQIQASSAMALWLQTTAITQRDAAATNARKAEIESLNAVVSSPGIPTMMKQQALTRLSQLLGVVHHAHDESEVLPQSQAQL